MRETDDMRDIDADRGLLQDPTPTRIPGEYAPPREIVTLEVARLSGRGSLEVGAGGLVFDGSLVGVESRIPLWGSSAAVLAVAAGLSVVVPNGEQVLMPGAVLAVGGLMWLRFRSEVGVGGVHRVPWSQVEHVVRLPAAPDTLAFVLTGPLGGRGTPEQVYFAPASGVEDLVDALRTVGPASLTIDTISASVAEEATPEED